jgi:glutamine synthetase
MTPRAVGNADDARALIEERGARHVQVALADITGQLRGKYLAVGKFLKALDEGLPLTHNAAASDFTDQVHAIDGLTAGDVSFGDGHVRVVPETCRTVPWEQSDRDLFFLLEYDDRGAAFDPRAILGRVLARARSLGYTVHHSCELEFRLFRETPQSLREKGYRSLEPFVPYSNYLGVLSQSAHAEFFAELTATAETLGVPIEAAHWELGAGFGEFVLGYGEGLRPADDAQIYKTFAKAFALRRGLLLSFMARFDEAQDGSSCHVNLSLRDREGAPVFHDARKSDGCSDAMRHFIGGAQRLAGELMPMMAPNVNSYKRFRPGFFAPIAATWGLNNRTVAMRVVPGSPLSFRLEHRVPGSDANPYLAVAAVLAAGLWGIENRIEPTEPTEGNSWSESRDIPEAIRLPTSLEDAVLRFERSTVAAELLGSEFVRVFAAGRLAHAAQFRSAVTDWELRRFLEFA